MTPWYEDSIFYHLYPLGLSGAPARNDFAAPPQARLESLQPWLAHVHDLGANAIYLGPVFESASHGYNTVDYFRVDRRLGNNDSLKSFVAEAHRLGQRVVLDGVFGHVGRDFWAFKDLRQNGRQSIYRDWFRGVDFEKKSQLGDAFDYEYWQYAKDLPRLNLGNPQVRQHLFSAIDQWIADYGIDGLRLDTADVLDLDFLDALREHCEGVRPDFWLMGEVTHGDYRNWAKAGRLHSVTNYEAYSGMSSDALDKKNFEIAATLERQFGENGPFKNTSIYNFLDNHDVDRFASKVQDCSQLYSLYCLLFTMPGVPSIYYGSEWRLQAKRTEADDKMLRPALDLESLQKNESQDLMLAMRRLIDVRLKSNALRYGSYRQLSVDAQHLVFCRETETESVIVAVNSSRAPREISPHLMDYDKLILKDLLNPPDSFKVNGPDQKIEVPAGWARILKVDKQ